MDSLFDSPDLTAARTASQQATTNATNIAGDALSLPDRLRETLTKKFSQDNPLYANRETAAKNFLTTYTQAPLDYTAKSAGGNSDVVYNPLQMQNLIQTRRAGALAPLMTANDLLGLGTGGIQNVIDATSNAFKGEVTKAQGEATNKRQLYEDLFAEAGKQADEAYKQKTLELNYAKLNKSGSGSNLKDLLSIYRLMKPSGAQQNNAINAQSGLDALNQMRSLLTKDKDIVTKANIPLFGYFNQDAQSFQKAKNEAIDVLARFRTGAAMNKDEKKTYDEIFSSFQKNKVTTQSLDRLTKIFQANIDKAAVPDVLDFLSNGMGGGSNSEWEIVEP